MPLKTIELMAIKLFKEKSILTNHEFRQRSAILLRLNRPEMNVFKKELKKEGIVTLSGNHSSKIQLSTSLNITSGSLFGDLFERKMRGKI